MTRPQAAVLVGSLELREQAIARLATWEGMRPGEILGLRVSDIDGDSLWVRRRLYKGDLDDPKNERSARQVALTTGTKVLLDFGSSGCRRDPIRIGYSHPKTGRR